MYFENAFLVDFQKDKIALLIDFSNTPGLASGISLGLCFYVSSIHLVLTVVI